MRSGLYLSLAIFVAVLCSGCWSLEALEQNHFGLGMACDYDTDAGGVSATFNFANVFSGVTIGPSLEYLRGKENYGYSEEILFKTAAEGDVKYNVVRGGVKGSYPVFVSDTRPIAVYPMLRPGIYRWSASEFEETETTFTLDFGGGVAYGPISFDLFSTTDGPDVGARLSFNIPVN